MLKGYDELSSRDEAGPEFSELRRVCRMVSGMDLTAPFFLNGMVLNPKWFSPKSLRFDIEYGSDYEQFKKVIQGLVFQEDLIPANCALVLNLFDAVGAAKNNTGRFDFNYVGQLHHSDGLLSSDLRLVSSNLTDKRHSRLSRSAEQSRITLKNLLGTAEMG